MDRTDWVLANPAQIVLNGSQVGVVLVRTGVERVTVNILFRKGTKKQRVQNRKIKGLWESYSEVFWTSEVEEAFDGNVVRL